MRFVKVKDKNRSTAIPLKEGRGNAKRLVQGNVAEKLLTRLI